MLGVHSRHGQLLPLEHYLEAGVPLVVHIRGGQARPELVELPECSCHAFVTFAPDVAEALYGPTIKVWVLGRSLHPTLACSTVGRSNCWCACLKHRGAAAVTATYLIALQLWSACCRA